MAYEGKWNLYIDNLSPKREPPPYIELGESKIQQRVDLPKERENRSVSIAISGAPGTGKTALTARLSELFDLAYVDEFSRSLLNSAGVRDPEEYPGGYEVFQQTIIELKTKQEDGFRRDGVSFVADRPAVDHFAYSLFNRGRATASQEWLDGLYMPCIKQTEKYDVIFLIEYVPEPEDDKLRYTEKFYSLTLQSLIIGLLEYHAIPYFWLPNFSHLSEEDGVNEKTQIIRKAVGIYKR